MRSILTNCQDVLLDCPHREQNEWTGDGMLCAESVNIGFDCYGMFYEWMMKFKDDQLPDGTLPCIIPSKDAVWEYNFANGPDWDSAIFHIPYYTFRYSGDRRIVDDMWENMNRSLHYFSTLSEKERTDPPSDKFASSKVKRHALQFVSRAIFSALSISFRCPICRQSKKPRTSIKGSLLFLL